MNLLLFLSPESQIILNTLKSKKITVIENAPICKQHKTLFGYTKSPDFIICTDNIKNTISPVKHYVNETVYHEAVHVIQSCAKGPIKIKDINLSPQKLSDVLKSSGVYGSSSVYEIEAYYLEDKPEQVNYYMKKYCF